MRALISVSDKTGIEDFSRKLAEQGIEIISTGGTFRSLKEAGIPVTEVSQITGFPECLDGRVKTLHPGIHAGILAIRENEAHIKQLNDLGITPIDLVVVNLYPFKETVTKPGVERAEAVENIDIGGPTMLRSAAKNYQDVTVITDPEDYERVLTELALQGHTSLETRFYLMQKVFEHTAHYDTLIADYLKKERDSRDFTRTLTLTFEKVQDMRYGENPHQQAAFYRQIGRQPGSLVEARQHNGKELSFNNINDTSQALELLKEFTAPAVVACKHGNPCGVASAGDITTAWRKAFAADKTSIYGGIVVSNREITVDMAREMHEIFLEVVVAPSYEKGALALLCSKKNIRVLELEDIQIPQNPKAMDMKKINGGLIIQTIDSELFDASAWQVATIAQPTAQQIEDMKFGMKVVKYVKSNAIAIVKDEASVGIGPGQVNRIWAAKQSFEHAAELISPDAARGAVLASDAYFPFADTVEAAHLAGIAAIVQPGGSVNDKLSIDKCNEYGIPMVFTGMRHFRH